LLHKDINGPEVAAFKNKNRDVKLTMDADLQTKIQQSIATDTSLLDNRVSVVVMEANTGDVLVSAQYPLPPVHNWDQLTMSHWPIKINLLLDDHYRSGLYLRIATGFNG
jgi:hypothetical protein